MLTLSERITYALGGLTPKITQAKLARTVGVTAPSVNDWKSGKTKEIEHDNAVKAAICLGVPYEWLRHGKGPKPDKRAPQDHLQSVPRQHQTQWQSESEQSQGQLQDSQIQNMNYRPPVEVDDAPPSRQTPVISWVQAGDYTAVVSGDLNNVIEWIPYHPRAGQHGFALIVKGASMEPLFNPDDRIYVNPTFQIDELHTGALVVMSCDGDTEATFKELVVEDGNYFLRPLNPNWQPRLIPIDHNCRLVGKVVGKFVNFE